MGLAIWDWRVGIRRHLRSFLFRLHRRTRVLFLAAGTIYVLGAIGVEMLGGLHIESHGGSNPTRVALQAIE